VAVGDISVHTILVPLNFFSIVAPMLSSQVYHLSIIRQRREVRTRAAAEKSLSTAADLGRVVLLFLKASAMTG